MLSLRTLLRNPIQFMIMIAGIALGVAVMVGIDLANTSAERAFELSTNAVTGRATHMITAGEQGLDESLYVQLRTESKWRNRFESAPVVIAYAASPQLDNTPITLLGIDPFAEPPVRSYLGGGNEMGIESFGSLLTVPDSILLSASLAQRYGLHPCAAAVDDSCRITLMIGGVSHDAYLTGLLEPSDAFARRALDTLILTDIATAQRLSNMHGRLTQIDLILPEDFDPTELSVVLPAGSQLVSSELRSSQVTEMTSAFRINLTALSLLALVVGVFLIYNAMTFSVVQRRAVFGTLRSLGYTREQVFGMVLAEAALVGAIGSILGLALGIFLGRSAVQMVSQTINDLFFVLNVRDTDVALSSLIKGGLAGSFSSLLAAAIPAWEAASIPPRLALLRTGLENKAQITVKRVAVIGIVVALIGAGILLIPTRNLLISFGGTSAVIIGLAALTPWVTVTLMQCMTGPLSSVLGLLGRLAPRNVIRSQSRTAGAVAALMIAVSVMIGVQVMISSFRSTVEIWLEQTMRGDIYVSAQGFSGTGLGGPLDPQVIARTRAHPAIEAGLGVRVISVESRNGLIDLVAGSVERPIDERLFLDAQGSPQQAWQMFKDGGILLSEPLANRLGISNAGGSLDLLTPDGWRSFPIAGIYADYASTRGTTRMSLDVYRRIWTDDRLNGLVLFVKPGADIDDVTTGLRAQLADLPVTQVSPSGVLREEAMVVFDRTFAITIAMQLITTLVAFIGVLNSLLALQLEKSRELGILRALGLSLSELRKLTLLETGLLGASAGLFALPTGYVLAWILIFVINQRSFGWTLQMHANSTPFIQGFLLSIGAAILAALYPTWRLSRIQAAEALRGD